MAFTYFFRDIEVLEQAADLLAASPPSFGPIRIWDAGCAFGQEPFSMAILLAQRMPPEQFLRVQIVATDIDVSNRFAEYIDSGTYPWDELKRMPHELFIEWFEAGEKQGTFRLVEPVRSRVRYIRHDLTTLQSPDCGFHMVISKNTLMHFAPQQRTDVLAMFARCLHPGGILVLGQRQDYAEADTSAFEQHPDNGLIFRKR